METVVNKSGVPVTAQFKSYYVVWKQQEKGDMDRCT